MRPAAHVMVALAVALGAAARLEAQPSSAPPGPYVIDLRGVSGGLPTGTSFYPPSRTRAVVPSRGFGISAGGHVMVTNLGPVRVGVGADFLIARGTTLDAVSSLRTLAPQLSLNFGRSTGWSYLSAGLGTGRVKGRLRPTAPSPSATAQPTVPVTSTANQGTVVDTEPVTVNARALNFGGGARWFLSSRVAVGFDVRFHKLSPAIPSTGGVSTPRSTLLAASAGLSFR